MREEMGEEIDTMEPKVKIKLKHVFLSHLLCVCVGGGRFFKIISYDRTISITVNFCTSHGFPN